MSGWGLGGGLSALYELSPRTRFGLAYQLESETNMKGTPRWHNIGPGLKGLLQAAVHGQIRKAQRAPHRGESV